MGTGFDLSQVYGFVKQSGGGFSDDAQKWFDEKLYKTILRKPFSAKSLVKRIQELLSEK